MMKSKVTVATAILLASAHAFAEYMPSQGRFISRDPIEEKGGLNLYAFCENDPINKWDYLGLSGHIAIASIATGRKMDKIELGGTAWIAYVPECDRTFEFDGKKVSIKKDVVYHFHTYGNLNGPQRQLGLNVSTTLGLQGATHTRKSYIDDSAEETLIKYVSRQHDLGSVAWNHLHNCTAFASTAWQKATGEYLDPSNGKTLGSEIPNDKLADFLKAQGMKEELIPAMILLAKITPMNTPHNLAQSIYHANGNKTEGWKNQKPKENNK